MKSDHDETDGISRRKVLECMTWAGTGVLWTIAGGVPSCVGILGEAKATEASGLTFLQISDSHIGFDKPANPNAIGTLEEAIDKIKSRMVTGTVSTANGLNGTYEMGQVAPDKGYEIFVTPQITIRRALTASGAWEQTQQGVRDVTGPEFARARALMQVFSYLKLKEQYTRLRTAGREKIGDRDAYVVLATRGENDTERLYFDVETGLLLRRTTYLRTIVGVIPEQTDFEDYRDVDGVKMPFTIRVSPVDAGNPYIVRKFTEIKLNVPVDESKFNKPAAAKP